MDLSTQAGQDILGDIRRNTGSVRPWRNLMLLCFDQKDIETFKTLQVICEGLDHLFSMKKQEAKREFELAVRAIRESKLKPAQHQLPNPIITIIPLNDAQRQTLSKLAVNPNSSLLLQKVADYYLNDWGLPDMAQKHLERALNFEPEDKEILQTLARAAEALTHITPAGTPSAFPFPTEETRSSLAQTMRLKLPTLLRRASGPLPTEQSQTLLKHHIEHLNSPPSPKRKDAGFKTANLGALHRQLKTLQSKIELIEQRTNPPAPKATAAIGFTPPPASAPDPISPLSSSELLSLSLADVHSGNLDDASAHCKQALELNPEQPLAWHTWATIGLGYFEKRDHDQAIRSFNEALRLEPNAVELWFNMGVAHSEKGDLEGALRCYLRSLFLAPENAKVRCNLGAVYFQNNQFTHAEQCFRKAIELRPDYARAWDNLGATLSALNELPAAAEACRKAIELKPDYAESFFKLGTILFQQEEFVQARTAFENAAQYRPDFPASFVYLAILDARTGHVAAAEKACKKFTALGGVPGLDWMAWQEIALGQLQEKRFEPAIHSAKQAALLQPSEPEPWFTLGMALQQSGKNDEAIEAYAHSLKLRADMPFAWYNLGLIRWAQHQLMATVEAMQHAIDHEPTLGSAWFYLACAREALQQTVPAIEAYRHTVKLDPKNVEAWQNLSLLLEETDRHEEAEEAKNKALAVLADE